MGYYFIDIVNEESKYYLGSVSMGWLDTNNVFDKYQEDNNEYSDIIFKTSKSNVNSLHTDIIIAANCDERLRLDIKNKLLEFAEFVKTSNGLICTIS